MTTKDAPFFPHLPDDYMPEARSEGRFILLACIFQPDGTPRWNVGMAIDPGKFNRRDFLERTGTPSMMALYNRMNLSIPYVAADEGKGHE